ncbi:TPA: hypothetical protein DCQ22_03735 [Candidatus Nomurabacteria bacterium]|nr:hypothetical protein [Candidatus Nomurabacteria bacterium]
MIGDISVNICPVCGMFVVPKLKRGGCSKKYCSEKCRTKAANKRFSVANPGRRKEINKEWSLRNVEKERTRKRKYAHDHREQESIRHKMWRDKNREYVNSRNRKYTKTNKEQRRLNDEKRRAAKNGCENKLTKSEWLEILSKHEYKCAKCGTQERISLDHIIPLSKGGTHSADNVQPLCISCNCKKYNKIEVVAQSAVSVSR